MAKLELQMGETLLKETWGSTLQGGKVKFPIDSSCYLTNQRFIYHDVGGWAPLYGQLGILLRLLIKGKRKDLPLEGGKVTRGKYAVNKDILSIKAATGEEVLLFGFKRWLQFFQEALTSQSGVHLNQTGEEEWEIRKN